MKKLMLMLSVMVMGLILSVPAQAGNLEPDRDPPEGSGMYTLSDLYYYLIEGRAGTIASSFQKPTAGPGSTMMNTKVIYDGIKAEFDGCGAGPGDVLSGATFFNTDPSSWGPRPGTIETRILSPDSETVNAGYYGATTLSDVDSDLATENIKQGVTVFGISGDPNVADTSDANAVAGEILNNKTAYVGGSKVTGNVTAGSSVTGTDGALVVDIPNGLYSGGDKTATAQDTALMAGNIKQGETIFGISGDPKVADTTTAAAADEWTIFSDQVAWSNGSMIIGRVETRNWTADTTAYDAGYYAHTDLVSVDSDLATENIKSGSTIFGVDGDTNVVDTSDADAVAGEILNSRTAYVGGSKVTGNVTAGTNVLGPDGSITFTITDGLYSGSKTATAQDSDLLTGNIRSGINIFGTAGDSDVVDTGSGDAAAEDMLLNKKAWVDGNEVTGNVPAGSSQVGTDGNPVVSIPNGLYSGGDKTATAQDSELAAGNIKDGVNIFGTEGTFPSDGDALAEEVKSGKFFYTDSAARITGSGTKTFSADTSIVEAGYYEQTDLSAVDNDLVAGNIKKDVAILGVDGTLYPGKLLRTGDNRVEIFGEAFSYQTTVYGGGIVVSDNVTGLMWASDGGQAGCNFGDQTDWSSAIDWADNLSFAEYTDWRIPNRTELNSIVNCGSYAPAINSTYFPNTWSDNYWSSTTFEANTDNAWFVNFTDGSVVNNVKTGSYYVRAVRGGIPWELNEENVNAMDGWTWLNGAAWSDAIADEVSWNKGTGDNTGNTGTYTPNSSGTLESRMEAVVAGRWSEVCTSINGRAITPADDGATGKPYISALAIADCVDGARNLADPIVGGTWEARCATLKTWATASGHSALPAVDYNGGDNEFNTACTEAGGDPWYKNTSSPLSLGINYCWGAACGSTSGDSWASYARLLGFTACSYQTSFGTSTTSFGIAFRVVVRPAAE